MRGTLLRIERLRMSFEPRRQSKPLTIARCGEGVLQGLESNRLMGSIITIAAWLIKARNRGAGNNASSLRLSPGSIDRLRACLRIGIYKVSLLAQCSIKGCVRINIRRSNIRSRPTYPQHLASNHSPFRCRISYPTTLMVWSYVAERSKTPLIFATPLGALVLTKIRDTVMPSRSPIRGTSGAL